MIIGTRWLRGAATRRADRQRGDRGAVAVEAALITPILILLVFGIIEFGLVFKDQLGLTSSVRAGARIASAEPRKATFAQDAADQVAREGGALRMASVKELWVYKADPAFLTTRGTPVGGSGTFTTCTVCVKFTWNASQNKFLPSSTTWTSLQQNACQGDVNRESVGVYLKFDHDAVTGLLFNSLMLDSHTVMSLEPMPTSGPCKP